MNQVFLQANPNPKVHMFSFYSVQESSLIQGMKDTVVTVRDKKGQQDDKSSADEKKYIRRGEKAKLDNMPSADAKKEIKNGEENKQDVVSFIDDKKGSTTGEEDKPYNMSSEDEDEEDNAGAEDPWNESTDASDTENNRSVKEKSDTPGLAEKPSQTFVSNFLYQLKLTGLPQLWFNFACSRSLLYIYFFNLKL